MSKKSLTFTAAAIALLAGVVAGGANLFGGAPVDVKIPTITAPAPNPPAAPSTPPGPLTPEADQALAELDQLQVAAPDQTPYNRKAFGQAWADTDRNGCDTRNDVLRRDLVDVQLKPGTRDCVVLSGRLNDPYTGGEISFVRGQGTSELVQIDHLVPLAWAWRNGAADWTPEQREQLANDFGNLAAVDGPSNQSKSDSGPALWMPQNTAYHCTYAARFVQVLTAYSLRVPADDAAALRSTLQTCTGGAQ